MKNIYALIVFTIFANYVFSQTENTNWKLYKGQDSVITDSLFTPIDTVNEIKIAATPGKVKINKDSRIDKLSKDLGTPNDGISVKINGYRVQLIASSKKGSVDGERAKFVGIKNDIPTYVDYRQPNFRLRVGDFKTKLEAQKLQHEIKDIFPSAIIITDLIELTKIKINK